MNIIEAEIRNYISGWMGQALCIEDLARVYATIISETNKRLVFMSEQIKDEIVKNNN